MRSREIKFRVWNDTEKLFVTIGMNIRESSRFWDSLNVNDSYIIQEFTGLKDKNSKEIYEGDIIKYPNAPYKDQWVQMLVEYPFTYKNMTDVEVIGNMFQNPELK